MNNESILIPTPKWQNVIKLTKEAEASNYYPVFHVTYGDYVPKNTMVVTGPCHLTHFLVTALTGVYSTPVEFRFQVQGQSWVPLITIVIVLFAVHPALVRQQRGKKHARQLLLSRGHPKMAAYRPIDLKYLRKNT